MMATLPDYAQSARWRLLVLALQERASAARVDATVADPTLPATPATLRAFSEALETVADQGGWFDKAAYDEELAAAGGSDGRLHAAEDWDTASWDYPDEVPAPKASTRTFGIESIRRGLVTGQFRPDGMGTGSDAAMTYLVYAEELLRAMRYIRVSRSEAIEPNRWGGPTGDEANRVEGMSLGGTPCAPAYADSDDCETFADWRDSPLTAGTRGSAAYTALGRNLPCAAPAGPGFSVEYELALAQRADVSAVQHDPVSVVLQGAPRNAANDGYEFWWAGELVQVSDTEEAAARAAFARWPEHIQQVSCSNGRIAVVSAKAADLGPAKLGFAAPCAGRLLVHACKVCPTRAETGFDGRYEIGRESDWPPPGGLPQSHYDMMGDMYVLSPATRGKDRVLSEFDGGGVWSRGWNVAATFDGAGVKLVTCPRRPTAPGFPWHREQVTEGTVRGHGPFPAAVVSVGTSVSYLLEYDGDPGFESEGFFWTRQGPILRTGYIANGYVSVPSYPAGTLVRGCDVDTILFEPSFTHLAT